MSSSFTITSAAPNNNFGHVMLLTVDASGSPVGPPSTVCLLDDGESVVVGVGVNQMMLLGEQPRNAPLVVETVPAAAVALPVAPVVPAPVDAAVIQVIGGAVTMPAVAPLDLAPSDPAG
jgi:hypothetical protein